MIKKITWPIVMTLFLFILSCDLSDLMNPSESVNNAAYSASASFSYDFAQDHKNQVVINAINSTITLAGRSDLSSIKIWGERIVKSESEADAAHNLEKLETIITNAANELIIETKQPSDSDGREYLVNYHLTIPATWNASIKIINGTVDIDSLSGDIGLQMVNGEIQLQEISGNLSTKLTNGKVDCKMRLPQNGACQITAINAEIQLLIPQNTSAHFAVGVINGSVSVSNLNIQNVQQEFNFVNGTLGTGQGTIKVEAINGAISVRGY